LGVAILPAGHESGGGAVVVGIVVDVGAVVVAVAVVVGIVVVVGAVVGAVAVDVVVDVGAGLSTHREVPPTVRSTLPPGQSQRAVLGFGRPPTPQAKFSAPSACWATNAAKGAKARSEAKNADRRRTMLRV
jgi:hypothetical protein